MAPQPEEVEILRDPLNVTVQGGDADIWVVMFVGQGAPPEAPVAGGGLDSVLDRIVKHGTSSGYVAKAKELLAAIEKRP